MENNKTPSIRFKGFTDPWEQRKWIDTVDISTEMVDPTSGEFDDMPHIAPGNIESFTGRILDNVKSVKEEQLISGKFRFRPGDVVYGKINPQLGKYFYASVDGLTSADAYVFNGKNGISQKFLFSLLQTADFFKYSVSVSKRSGMPKINRDELNAYSFLAPNAEEQNKIGDFLLELDHLITLHQRKYNKLLNVKKSMLGKMFPKNGSNIPEIRFKGFTDPWEQRKLGDLGSLKNGMNFSKDAMGHGYAFVNLQNIFGNNVVDVKSLGLAEASEKQLLEYSLQKGDVLFVRSSVKLEGVGEAALVAETLENTTYSGFIIRFRDEYGLNNDFKKFVFATKKVRDQIMSQATNSANKNISQSVLENLIFEIPSKDEQKQIGEYFSNLDNLITLHQRELEKLQNIKKSMLEKMFV